MGVCGRSRPPESGTGEKGTVVSELRCTCGQASANATHPLASRGDLYHLALLREHDYPSLWEGMLAALDAFLNAVLQGQRDHWLRERFGAAYPCDTPNKEVFGDIVMADLRAAARTVYQCEHCGRLWVEEGADPVSFCPFRPEGDGRGTLRIRRFGHDS